MNSEGVYFPPSSNEARSRSALTNNTYHTYEEETEKEAIELIRKQQIEAKTLQEEVRRKDGQIESMALQLKQVDIYKEQIQNLKK